MSFIINKILSPFYSVLCTVLPYFSILARFIFRIYFNVSIVFTKYLSPSVQVNPHPKITHILKQGKLFEYYLLSPDDGMLTAPLTNNQRTEIWYYLENKKYRVVVPLHRSIQQMCIALENLQYVPVECEFILYSHVKITKQDKDIEIEKETDYTALLNEYAGPDGTFHSQLTTIDEYENSFKHFVYSDNTYIVPQLNHSDSATDNTTTIDLYWMDSNGDEHVKLLHY